MKTDNNQRFRRFTAVSLALLILISAFAPAGTVGAQQAGNVSISQTANAGTVAPGETVTLEATVTGNAVNGPAIDVDLPDGWTIISQSPDGGTYKASENQWVWLSGSHTVTYTVQVPDDAAEGDYTITAEGSGIDPATNNRTTDTTQTTVTVDANDPPSADAGSDQTVDEGATVDLDASASSDPDGDDLSYSWTQTGGPDVSLSDAQTATPSFDAPAEPQQPQTYTFEVTVSDGQATDTDTLSVTVEPVNDPPTVDAGSDQTVTEGDSVQLAGSASDVDDSSLTYSWTQTGGSSVTLSDADTATPTFTAPDVDADATLTFEVSVSDGQATDTDAVTVTVTADNQPPTADFTVDPSSPAPGEQVSFDASASSDDGTIESYEWTIDGVDTGSSGESTLLESDFESGSLATDGWTHDAMSADASAGVSDATSNSGSQSAYHHQGEGALVSPALDVSGADSLTVEYWIQKGADSFSENPDAGAGEDMIVEYLDSEGNWVEIGRTEDSVEPGAAFTESVTIDDAGALHDGFQLRFHQESASSATGDYWHVDDVSVVATSESGAGTVEKSGQSVSHTFGQTGSYDVSLTITDDDGATDSVTKAVEVSADQQPQPETVPEVVAGEDGQISTSEIQQAISWWTDDEVVPGTEGETIDTQTMQELIDMWVENEPVASGGGSQ